MATLFNDLLVFFGIPAAPATFADFVPWFFSVLCAVGLVLFCFGMVRRMVVGVTRTRW